MVDAASTFETSVNFYQTTRCNPPEDSHLLAISMSVFRKGIAGSLLARTEMDTQVPYIYLCSFQSRFPC
jgi:hypothetical protein